MIESFGEFHKRIRLESGYKAQRDLARAAGISPATISRIEANLQRPEPETLAILSKYLKDITYPELLQKAGYPDLYEKEILTPIVVRDEEVKYKTSSSAKELVRSLNLTDEDIVAKFEIILDGKSLTRDEVLNAIAFLRARRQIDQ